MPHHVCQDEHIKGLTSVIEVLHVLLTKLQIRVLLSGYPDHFTAELEAHTSSGTRPSALVSCPLSPGFSTLGTLGTSSLTYHLYVISMPCLRGILGSQPSAASLLTSKSFRGVPSGFDRS